MKHPTAARLLCALLALCLLGGSLVACSGDSEVPEGYQYATCNGEYFRLFVPTQWTVNTESGVSGGCYSLLEGTAVSMTEVPFDKPADGEGEDLTATLEDFFTAHTAEIAKLRNYKAEKEFDITLGSYKAKDITYSATVGEDTYRYRQVLTKVSGRFYLFTYSSKTDTFDYWLDTVDEILENAATATELPEALLDIDLPAEQLLAAMFNLLVAKTSREIQPIPEDRPSKFSRNAQPAAADAAPAVEKGNDWSSLQQSVTLFMNGGKLLGLRPKDIAGLFYNEGGAPKGTVGDIRLFLKHSLIEVTPEIAPQLIERLGTCEICGYEVNVREDKGRPEAGANAPYEREIRPRERERRGASYAGRGNSNFRRDREERGNFRDRRDSRDRGDRNERGNRSGVFYDKFSRRPRRRD
jgi:hypothetical protein